MLKPGAQIQNLRSTADRGTSGEHEAEGVACTAPEVPRKAFPRQELGAACRDLTRGSVHAPWCPLSPISTLEFQELKKGGVLRVVFRVFFFML